MKGFFFPFKDTLPKVQNQAESVRSNTQDWKPFDLAFGVAFTVKLDCTTDLIDHEEIGC